MQCFLQLFDHNGSGQIKGSSKFKDHIGWLPLLAWDRGDQGPLSSTTSAIGASALRSIHILLRSDDPAVTTLANMDADGTQLSKGTLDCFKDGEDPAWYLRLTLQDPISVTLFHQGGDSSAGTGVTEVTMSGPTSSIDYRDAASKVTYLTPSGAIWDPDQEVCRVFDPDDPVSRSPQ
jgi:type VI protein secretion system component Hcp